MAGDNTVTYNDLKEVQEKLASTFKTQFQQYRERADEERKQYGEALSDTQEKMDEINDRISELEAEWQQKLDHYKRSHEEKETREEKRQKVVEKFMRKGEKGLDAEETELLESITDEKLLATDTDPDGGYLVPRNQSQEIIEYRRAISPFRQFARVVTISQGDSFEQPVRNDTDFSAGWTGERETSGENQTGQFDYVKIPTHELDAAPQATRQMLEDTAFDIEGWIRDEVGGKFARMEAHAFALGDGHMKPQGILTDDRIKTIKSGAADEITHKGLIRLVYDIEENEYLRNARLFMNRKTVGEIRSITDDNNRPIYEIGDPDEGPSIEGVPFSTATDMDTVAAGANVILYGDLQIVYTIVDRLDIWFQRDPYTVVPKIKFYYRTRVGGQVVRPEGARIMEVGAFE